MLIPRSRGAMSGVLLIILGAFGALIPLVGPYFDFTVGPTDAWNFNDGHLWLSVVPGAVVVAGGLLLTLSANRATAGFGAWMALVAGVWFVVGSQISRLWNDGTSIAGHAAGGTGQQVGEQLAFYDGLGALIVAFSAFALGRLAVRSVRDAELAAEAAAVDDRDRDVVVDRDRDVVVDRDRDVVAAPAGEPATVPAREAAPARFDREPEREPVAVAADRDGDGVADDTGTDTLTAADRVRMAADSDATATQQTVMRRRQGGIIGRFRR